MADLTIAELAKLVGVQEDRLLEQIKEAGLSQTKASDSLSNEERSKLLMSLKGKHGDDSPTESSPKRITLKRKTIGTLKSSDNQGRSKSVNVEVRKKRTYVKRSVEEAQEAQLEAEKVRQEEEKAQLELEAKEAAKKEKTTQEKVNTKGAPAARSSAVSVAPAESKPETRRDFKKGTLKKESFRSSAGEGGNKKTQARRKDRGQADDRKYNKIRRTDDFILDGDEDVGGSRRRGGRKLSQGHKQHKFEMPTEFIAREIEIPEAISVSELAQRLSVKGAELVKTLMNMGVMATINLMLDQDTSILLVEELGHTAKPVSDDKLEEDLVGSVSYEGEELPRAPVITVMGHVDHGKTSLLDYIRKSSVTEGEAGGITQHIGAYHVETEHGMLTFLDTPGHAAFSAMRARGAQATDIVILVVAADDGVKPQTEEAIQHAQASEVPIVVAINKIDKEGADSEKIKSELSAKGLAPEDWGGDTQFIEVSAHTGKGIPELLEAVLLQAEILELKAVVDCPAKGVVIESRLDKGRGPVATVLIQNGTLKNSDIILVGHEYGRVRALTDEKGGQIKSAGPSLPVEVLGLNGTPEAGDEFFVVEDERKAREVAEFRREKFREHQIAKQQIAKMEGMFAAMGKDDVKVVNIVLKTDVRGSLEAISSALLGLGNEEVSVNIISSGVGGISESDVQLAQPSNASIIGFNVRADKSAKTLVENEGLDLRYYSIIYNLIDDVKAVLGGLLSPDLQEEILGVAEVRDIFNSPKFGSIAGSMVIEGTVFRNKPIRVLRDDIVIYEGELESLRRFKDEANEVRNGMECGIGVKNYTDVRVGDKIEVFETKEVARTL
ncbi:MAG: translation initiation factor IF-2 [SAR86 cluster bacterium]|uniref:Translation initiation factor IF-2 n=1 Tax=SAR86 cluster bacterium TaxID=2030880 RepID=A0A2A5CH55_9GAMM|nr:MAG: translation initiation factor IF-2 [SAR86 cluster bacterium]